MESTLILRLEGILTIKHGQRRVYILFPIKFHSCQRHLSIVLEFGVRHFHSCESNATNSFNLLTQGEAKLFFARNVGTSWAQAEEFCDGNCSEDLFSPFDSPPVRSNNNLGF